MTLSIRPAILFLAIFTITCFGIQSGFTQILSEIGNLEVVDANDNRVGKFIGLQEQQFPQVALRINDHFIVLAVAENSLSGNSFLLFESLNCTGVPFLPDNSRQGLAIPLIPPVAIIPPDYTVYLPTPGSSSIKITATSALFSVGPCQNLQQAVEASAFPAQSILDLADHYIPPFRIQDALETQSDILSNK